MSHHRKKAKEKKNRKVAAKTVSIQKAKNAGTTVAAMRDVTKGAKEQKGQNVIKAADEKNAKNAKSAKNVNTSQTAATTKNKKNTPKKYTFFQQIYRTLCYIGLKVQFKTYNSRRRVRRFFRPVAGTVASFLRHSVTQPVIGAFREFGAICSELRGISAGAADNARNAEKRSVRQVLALHKGFVAGVFNILLPILCIGVLLGVTLSITRSPHSLEVTCNGKVLGYIEDESVYNDALFLLRQRMPSSSEDYRSTFTPSYTVAAVSKSMNMSAETLCEAILADSQNVDNAYGLYIDGELCAAAKSYGDIQFIMQTFLDQYKTGTPGESVSFTGQTEIISGLFASDKIVSSQNFAKTISTKRTETQFYTVNDGDTAQSIANVANMSYERLMELNKSLTDTPQAGTSVLLEKELPVLSVQNVRTVTVKESIPFSKKTVKDDKQYTTYSKCVTQGQNGVREVMQQITEVNGVQVSCEVLSSTVVKAPVDASAPAPLPGRYRVFVPSPPPTVIAGDVSTAALIFPLPASTDARSWLPIPAPSRSKTPPAATVCTLSSPTATAIPPATPTSALSASKAGRSWRKDRPSARSATPVTPPVPTSILRYAKTTSPTTR